MWYLSSEARICRTICSLKSAICNLLASGLVLGAGLRGQTQPPTFRADTRLVEVNALVADRDGRPLDGLTRDDFIVLEDGKPQSIELFAIAGSAAAAHPALAGGPAATAAPGAPPPRGEYSNRATSAGGVTVIVLDRLNTGFEDQKQARDQIIEFLKTVGREDRIALYVLQSGSLQILHDFTRDNASLIAALNRYQARTSRSKQAGEARPLDYAKTGNADEDAEFQRWLDDKVQQVQAFYLRDRVKLTADAFETVANHLAGVRGRKNLVWISSAFPLRIDEPHGSEDMTSTLTPAMKAINGANIAVYAVDARQLNPPPLAALQPTKEVVHGQPFDADFPKSTFEKEARSVDTLQSVADATGGRAFSVLGNIGKGIRQAVEDSRLTYVLGYYPTHAKWDSTYHTIKVSVNRPGASVRARKGYYATPVAPPVAATSDEGLVEAMRSPLEATELGVTARVAKGAAANSVAIAIRPSSDAVTLTRTDGRWIGQIDIVIAQSMANGRMFKTFAVKADLELTDEQHAQMLKDGLTFDRTIALRPDSHQLHVIVRDRPSGATGSVIIPTAGLR